MTTNRYANGHRRRQLRARVLNEEDHCGICGEPVNKMLKTPHPMSPDIDEILPVSRGGDPLLRSNVQLTHMICNRRKSDKLIVKHNSNTITTSRVW